MKKIRFIINRKYTGFTDKNNKKIYVGNICRTFDHTGKEWIARITQRRGNFMFHSNYDAWIHDYWSKELEIIGNIYENPKLLKG